VRHLWEVGVEVLRLTHLRRFATSQTTAMLNTAAIPGEVLATSNGMSAADRFVCRS